MSQPRACAVAYGSETADRILMVAEKLFAEHGFDAVSMNAIAEAAGMSKANVFHHFTSKRDLYHAVLRYACRDASQHLDQLGSQQVTMAERLAQFARSHLQSVLQNAQATRLSLRELMNEDTRQGQELAEQVYGDKFSRFVAILSAGQKSGELRADIDPAAVATVLIGANLFFFQARDVLRHLPEVGFSEQPDLYSTLLADILLNGILPAAKPGTMKNKDRP